MTESLLRLQAYIKLVTRFYIRKHIGVIGGERTICSLSVGL